MRVTKGSSFVVSSPAFVAVDGETPTDCGSDPTCTVTREDGTALTAATVTNLAAPGLYTALGTTTHSSQCDRLQIVWTGTVGTYTQVFRQTVEVVGGLWVTVPELRTEQGLADPSTYPKALLESVRDGLVDQMESYLQVPMTRRYERDQLDGNDTRILLLTHHRPRTVLSVTVNGTAGTVADFDLYDWGAIEWSAGIFQFPNTSTGQRNCVIAYEYGYDAPPDLLRREAVAEIARRIRATSLPPTAGGISITSPDGFTTRLGTPDRSAGRPTGNIPLDALLNEYREPVVGVA